MKLHLIWLVLVLTATQTFSQKRNFTRQDTLRGSITPERKWWDLTYYDLNIKVDTTNKTINGKNTVYYSVLQSYDVMQIDLQPPMQLQKAIQNGKSLEIKREGNAHFIKLTDKQEVGTVKSIELQFGGVPKVAVRPPWDGGITWNRDNRGLPFIASTCQGIGASVWWPCKDHLYDEADSMLISVNVPANLTNVSNGRLRNVDKLKDGTKTFHWFVSNPISNYVVNINIGDYVHFGEKYAGEKGELDLDYYVIRDNLKRAKKQFTEVPRMLKAFEHWFGPYPFYEDSYKLVEAPYLGMEHQSSVTYGNDYQNGYRGTDLSDTGWGMKFDFIIIHESGHEWFANSITYKDQADMWIHESFTNYSENLFLEYYYGKEAGADYVIGTRKRIMNDRPIIGIYNVNYSGSGDMYYKGGNMLHTLRQVLNDDARWREILRGINKEFYHKTVTSQEIEDYMSKQIGRPLNSFFDQYLRTTKIPVLEYAIKDKQLSVRWSNVVHNFDMPVKVFVGDKQLWLHPTTGWSSVPIAGNIKTITLDRNFYVSSLKCY
ncbi:M1 family metallopeptidase [Fulvivirgaceae bacterium BMA12]|uniref:M1 family metallopeptidase n=1 Tax=Agaribacillus aureus TaxID=3051825 RepID=A0ABT8L593_9BACT|nr:M1 family metallopeptidase [Fulvivirgaceae bacterium BMA12]